MDIKAYDLRKEIIEILDAAGRTPAAFNADLLLEHLAGITKLKMLTDSKITVPENIAEEIKIAAHKCADGIPLQHIIGFTEFMGLRFKVNSDVLIPRPDTEILVNEALDIVKSNSGKARILDLCTGSGCIAVSLANFTDDADIAASDISEKALAVAKANALQNSCENKIIFYHGSFFEPFKDNEKFDIIVSNPPYIPTEDIKSLDDCVKNHEPISALDGGCDGLFAYRKIIKAAPLYLNKDGYILFEVGIGQSEDVAKLLKENFTDIKTVRDYGGIERVVYGKLL